VEASTEGISREVANVQRDVTAILNLLQQPSRPELKESHPAKGSPLSASHTTLPKDSAASTSYQNRTAFSTPESQGQQKVQRSAPGYQSPVLVEAEVLPLGLQTHPISATATIVFSTSKHDYPIIDVSQTATEQAVSVTNKCKPTVGESADNSLDSAVVEMDEPELTVGQSSVPPKQNPSRAPTIYTATTKTKSQDIMSTQADLELQDAESLAETGLKMLQDNPTQVHAPGDGGYAGNLVRSPKSWGSSCGSGDGSGIWRRRESLSGKRHQQRRNMLLQEGSEQGTDSQHSLASPETGAGADDLPLQPRRICRGRWSSCSMLRAGLDDTNVGQALQGSGESHPMHARDCIS
jgi:hypothetical protein